MLSSATGDEAEPQAWHEAVGFERCGELRGINDHGVGEIVYLLASVSEKNGSDPVIQPPGLM